MNDTTIRRYFKENGEKVSSQDDDQYETYSLEEHHFPNIHERMRDATTHMSGLGALPAMFFVGLVSAYDVFLAQLIRCYFVANPSALSSSERNLSFRDLMEIGSLQEAREKIIEKEIESIMRKSHTDQIKWLENRLGIPLSKDLDIWPDFIEICERRNLLSVCLGSPVAQIARLS